jgi:tripartite-type tricarboxylate transporter receptor subunit TctC
MARRFVSISTVLMLLVAGGGTLHAQSFFDGKTIRIVVGFAPGGGFDTYARVISRHMGRHIPGSPTVVVENMTGAGSLIAANHLYRVAKPDGLTIGHFNGALFLGQVLGSPGSSSMRGSSSSSARRSRKTRRVD